MAFDRPRAAVTAAGFCAFLDLYAPQAVLPQLADSFHISPAVAGGMVGISTLAVALSAPFVGMAVDRLGRKPTIVGAALLLIIPTVMLMLANSLDQIMVWRFFQGVFLPAIFSATVAYVSEEYPPDEASSIIGLYIAGSALGGFSGRFVTAMMAEQYGWRSGFAALTVATLASAAMIWAWLPAGHKGGHVTARVPALTALKDHLTNPSLMATCLAGSALLFSMVATFTYVNFHLAAPPFSMGPAALGMIFLVYLIGAAITPATGMLIQRLGRRGAFVLALATSCSGLILSLLPSLTAIIIGLALFVTGIFIAQSSATGFVGQAARIAKPAAVGLYVCCYYLGGSAGAVVPGWLVWSWGGWAGCVGLTVLVLGASAAVAFRAWRVKAV